MFELVFHPDGMLQSSISLYYSSPLHTQTPTPPVLKYTDTKTRTQYKSRQVFGRIAHIINLDGLWMFIISDGSKQNSEPKMV